MEAPPQARSVFVSGGRPEAQAPNASRLCVQGKRHKHHLPSSVTHKHAANTLCKAVYTTQSPSDDAPERASDSTQQGAWNAGSLDDMFQRLASAPASDADLGRIDDAPAHASPLGSSVRGGAPRMKKSAWS